MDLGHIYGRDPAVCHANSVHDQHRQPRFDACMSHGVSFMVCFIEYDHKNGGEHDPSGAPGDGCDYSIRTMLMILMSV